MSQEQDHFLITSGARAGEKIPLVGASLPVVLGRIPPADVVINIEGISRRHARLSRDISGYVIEDLNSSNGTYVNDERIQGTRLLKNGDVVRLGLDIDLKLVAEESDPAAEATVLKVPPLASPEPAPGATVIETPALTPPPVVQTPPVQAAETTPPLPSTAATGETSVQKPAGAATVFKSPPPAGAGSQGPRGDFANRFHR